MKDTVHEKKRDDKLWIGYNVFWRLCPYCLQDLRITRVVMRSVYKREIYYKCPKCGKKFVKESKYVVEDSIAQYWIPVRIEEAQREVEKILEEEG
jgi:superfamily II helicase